MPDIFRNWNAAETLVVLGFVGMLVLGAANIKSDMSHQGDDIKDHEERIKQCEENDQMLKEYYIANGKDIEHIKEGINNLNTLMIERLSEWEASYARERREEENYKER